MNSYRIDFDMNRGHEMILDRDTGIYRSELDEIELSMLYSRRIPYLLPIDWFELDGKVTFRYELTGMKMLLHRLQQQSLTMDQYYQLLLGVTDALNECKHYMLRPEGCLLDDQFIFIGEQLHDIRLAYLPMKGNGGEQPIGSGDLLSLIVRLTSYIEHIDGKGLKRVLHHLNGTKWPLTELRATLLDLIGGHHSKSENPGGQHQQVHQQMHQHAQRHELRQPYQLTNEPRQPYEKFTNEPEQPQLQPAHESHAKPEPFSNPVHIKSKFDEIPYVEEQGQEDHDSKRKWIAAAGLVIATACVWRFIHFAGPTRQSLLLSAGLTLLLVVALLLVWRKRKIHLRSPEESQFEMEPLLPDSSPFAKLHNWHADDELNESMRLKPLNERKESNAANPVTELHVVAANRPVPLAEPTVMLASVQQKQLINEQTVWLKRCWEGQETKIELSENCFKIGRGGEQVSYADHANGVSRIHLEIEYLNGEHRVKDLGSRNGSLLNGHTMIPYKTYKLATGDVVHLAGVTGPSYELKTG